MIEMRVGVIPVDARRHGDMEPTAAHRRWRHARDLAACLLAESDVAPDLAHMRCGSTPDPSSS